MALAAEAVSRCDPIVLQSICNEPRSPSASKSLINHDLALQRSFPKTSKIFQKPSARVATSIKVGVGAASAVVSACLSSSAVAALTPSTP